MVSFITLYHGETAEEALIIASSADPDVVARFAAELLETPGYSEDRFEDPALSSIQNGKRLALKIISNLRHGGKW